MRVKFNDKIYRLKEVESGVDSLMELVEEPRYRDGDFLKSITGSLFIHNGKYEYDNVCAHFYISGLNQRHKYDCKVCWEDNIDGFCSPEEVDMIHNELEKDGKRWNAEKKCIEDIPVYKDGDFVVNELDAILIFKEAYGDLVSDHAYLPVYGELVIDKFVSCKGVKRHATTEEKQRMTEALAERGKRWNADKKCVEDIPKPKFKAGDKVKIKDGISSKTHRFIRPYFVDGMGAFIGKELTVKEYNSDGFVVFSGRYPEHEFAEDWLEPWSDEPKVGDWVIYWDSIQTAKVGILACIRPNERYKYVVDDGDWWRYAVKWNGTKEHLEKIRKGEI